MDLFEDLRKQLGCMYISELPSFFRSQPPTVVNALLGLTFRKYPSSQWADMFHYLQIQFEETELTNFHKIRAVLNRQNEVVS